MSKKFYHGSPRELKIGKILIPRPFKSIFGDMEKLIEHFRPPNFISRKQCVYMVSVTNHISWAGGSENFVYLIEPIGNVQKHHQGWLESLDYNLNYEWQYNSLGRPKIGAKTLKKLLTMAEKYAKGYWSGKRSPNSGPFEYIAQQVKIIKLIRSKW